MRILILVLILASQYPATVSVPSKIGSTLGFSGSPEAIQEAKGKSGKSQKKKTWVRRKRTVVV